ncbi:GNAT family N-acetyltransferase [Actinoplanes sp. NPDC049118]|uniref:GNAT family N-acetyltransferase n=1 Tax=Actinoplanes sp. NPDC049118 TaxID=3155769 RepID=UPI0033C1A9B0
MEYPTTFEAHGLRLRPYRDADVPNLLAAFRDPDTRRYMSGTPGEVDAEKVRAWVHAPASGPDRHSYAVADPATDELLAGAVLHVLRRRASAEAGFWVCPGARGRGVATATTRALADLSFAHGVRRVELFIRADNPRSQRVALAAGFRREGELRSVLPGPGTQRHSAAIWSRLSTDDGVPAARLLPDLPGGALTDAVVTLRPAGPDDATLLSTMYGRAVPRHHAGIEARWLSGEGADLLVVESATGAVAAGLTLEYRDPELGQAVLGGTLAPGRTTGAAAARGAVLLADWAFGIGVARLAAAAAADDARWRRVLVRAGFRREGRLVSRLPRPDGVRIDELAYALLPTDRDR